jgi:cytochrome c peroxidase
VKNLSRRVLLLLIAVLSLPLQAESQMSAELRANLVELGWKLFHDVRLSGNGAVACSHCHNLSLGGSDPRGHSLSVDGEPLRRNAPTVYNAVFNFRQTWDGHARTLKEQAAGVIVNPLEMGGHWPTILQRLNADADMVARFNEIFAQAVTKEGVTSALEAFEETLITLDTPYDRYISGDPDALSESQLKGLELFHSLGCNSCHNGAHLGGNQFQNRAIFYQLGGDQDTTLVGHNNQLDIVGIEFHSPHVENLSSEDQGRFEITGEPQDRFVFKVPSLRNVALTAPYFHDGTIATLDLAVKEMAAHQLGVVLTAQQSQLLVSFLTALTSDSLRQSGQSR